jgi:DNA-binding beta-propeller fold protein YncE
LTVLFWIKHIQTATQYGNRSSLHSKCAPVGFAIDGASNRILVSDFSNDTVVSVDLSDGNRTIVSGAGIGSGVPLDYPRRLVLDLARSRVLVANGFGANAVVSVDLSSGMRQVFSGPGHGTGPPIGHISDQLFDSASDQLIALDTGKGAVIRIELSTGNRATVSDSNSPGPPFVVPRGIDLDPAHNRALVTDAVPQRVTAVDLADGKRTIVLDNTHGNGPPFDDDTLEP